MDESGQPVEAKIAGLIEESAEDLYEHAPCGYISMLPNGTIVRVNSTFLQWTGFSREELLYKKRFQDLLAIGSKIYYETHFAPLLQMQGFINEVNLDLKCGNHKQMPVLLNIVQRKSEDGKPLLNRATLFNITDRKNYEKELLLARKKAEAASKAKAEFLSTVSHEIRTPLNAIIGISNLLGDTDPTPKQRELFDILKFSADNLLHLINDILDFSKIEAGKVSLEEKDFNLKELLYSIIYSLGVKAEEKGIELLTEIHNRLPEYLVGDQVKIGQVLTNLIGNAIKFTNAGSVSVAIEVLEQKPDKSQIRFSVTDTGIGIAADKIQKIFEEFTQASYDINAQYGGTGLGLSISNRLLKLYGSQLHVQSEAGKGSEFWFTLTVKHGSKPADTGFIAPTTKNQPENSLSGVYLLLAEDNDINVLVISKFFSKWGVKFDVAKNGEEAVDMVQKNNYQLVLMDLQMPVLDGYDASLQIRNLPDNKYEKLPIVALSASSNFELKEKLAIARINNYIGKPFEPQKLYNLIAHYSKKSLESAGSHVQNSQGAQKTTSAGIDLSEYLSLTEGDEEARQKLFGMTIRDLEDYQKEFRRVLKERNLEEFSFLAHKCKMMLGMLKAQQVIEAIHKARKVLSGNTASAADLETATQEIEQQMNRVIGDLNNYVPGRASSEGENKAT